MTTRQTLKQEILDDFERTESEDGPRVLKAISAAIKYYQPKRFFFNESRATTFTTTAGQAIYTFASDIGQEFYKIDGAILEDDSNDYILRRRDYREIEELNDANEQQNRPTSYAYIDRALALYFIPDEAYVVRLLGHIKLAEPVADTDTGNEWFTEAYELIRCRAKKSLATHEYQDFDMAQAMQAAEAQALSSLMSATMDKVALGCLEPTEF